MIDSRYKQHHLGFMLFILLIAINMLTYRGWAMSGDELFIFDSAESFARRGNTLRTYQFNQVGDLAYDLTLGDNGEPWIPAVQEPFMAVVISPLIHLGQALSDVGTMHIVWLFNTFIIAITGLSLYRIALSWGYNVAPSWLMALSFGIATNAVFYGRLLFREPLMALFVLWAFAFAVEIGKQLREGKFSLTYIGFFIIAFLGAFLTKGIAILIVPALLIVMLPSITSLRRNRRHLIIGAVMLISLIGVGLLLINNGVLGARYQSSNLFDRLAYIQWNFVLESILGFQFSLGRSFWLYSPVLLIGIFGAVILVKRGQWRIIIAPLLTLFLFSAWYGIVLTVDWLGGWGWGPRYLVPLIPIFMLWTLPVFAQLDTLWKRVAVGGIVLVGVGIQFLGMAVPLSNYYTDLFFNNKIYDFNLIYTDRAGVEAQWRWMDAIWEWEWSPIHYHLSRLDFSHLDIAWRVASPAWFMPLALAVIIGISMGWVLWIYRQETIRRPILVHGITGGIFITLSVILGIGIVTLRHDSRYVQEWTDVVDLIEQLNPQVHNHSAVLIDQALYTPLFMNYFKAPVLVATLPYAPGEVYDGVAPEVVSEDSVERIGFESVYAIDWTADHYDRIWLVASASPFETIKIRPIERYMVDHYFPVSEVYVSYRARAIQFLAVDAPVGEPGITLDYAFEDQLQLVGMDLPMGSSFSAGDIIPVSVVWEVQQPLNVDYNIGIYLLNADGVLVAQQDGTPQATFGHTSQWQIDVPYRDNHAVQLTTDLPAGEYQLIVAIYNVQDQQRLTVYDSETAIVGDGVPLGTIVIEQ